VEFDFRSAQGDTGALFSADGSHALADPGDPDEDDIGTLNIYLGTGPDSGVTGIIADMWFMGEVAVEEDPDAGLFFNDGATHHVKVEYSAVSKILQLTVDDLEPEFDDFDFFRDTSNDIVRLGDENNADFGGDINDGFNGLFDNLRIEGTLNVPEPSALLLIGFGSLISLACGAQRRR
jgi:hypothetical protein